MAENNGPLSPIERKILHIIRRGALPPSPKNYHGAFTASGQRKAEDVMRRLKKICIDYKIEPSRLAYLSIGGSDGAEIAHVLKHSPLQFGLLLEQDDEACEQAEKRQKQLQQEEHKTLKILSKDVGNGMNRANAILNRWKMEGKVDGLVVSVMAVLHELPDRACRFEMDSFLAGIGMDWDLYILFAREPCQPVGWPEIVDLESNIPSASLCDLTSYVADRLSFPGNPSPPFVPLTRNRIKVSASLGVETLHKLFYLEDLSYEIEEKLVGINVTDLAVTLKDRLKLSDVNIELFNTDSFIKHYKKFDIKAFNGAMPLPKPFCFFWLTAYRISDSPNNRKPSQESSSEWGIDRELEKLKTENNKHKKYSDSLKEYHKNTFNLLGASAITDSSIQLTHDGYGYCRINKKSFPLQEQLHEGLLAMAEHLFQLVQNLSDNWLSRPLLLNIANKKIKDINTQLWGLVDDRGYTIHGVSDIGSLLKEHLFQDSLIKLRATSIQINDKKYENYRSYWDDSQLDFESLNKSLIERKGTLLERIYLCDDLIACVSEKWFITAMKNLYQSKKGANYHVYVIERPQGNSPISDFGIYTLMGQDGKEVDYILDAPLTENSTGSEIQRELNVPLTKNGTDQETIKRELTVVLHATDVKAKEFNEKYKAAKDQCGDEIELIDDSPYRTKLPIEQSAETAVLDDLFHGDVLLRNLEPLRRDIPPPRKPSGFIRKYDPLYAEIVSGYINNRYMGRPSAIIYVGDTSGNDGGVIRNLQKLGHNVYGFICDTSMAKKYQNVMKDHSRFQSFWFNDVLYCDHWVELVGFAGRVMPNIGNTPLAIFDIDQTLWAGKGVNERAIQSTRIQAILQLMDELIESGTSDRAMWINIAENVYQLICGHDFIGMTMDNEDFKAIITILFSLNVFRFAKLRPFDVINANDLGFAMEAYCGRYKGILGIQNLLADAENQVMSGTYKGYANKMGFRVDQLRTMLGTLRENIADERSAPFTQFRDRERDRAFAMAGAYRENLPIDQILTINRSTWDFAKYLQNRGIHLMALSDRPDEATLIDENRTLLKEKMLIHGYPLDNLLADIR